MIMGQAKQRGTFEKRQELAIKLAKVQAELKREALAKDELERKESLKAKQLEWEKHEENRRLNPVSPHEKFVRSARKNAELRAMLALGALAIISN